MTFTVKERLLLLQLPPARGSILLVKPIREFREACSFSEEEVARLKFRQEGAATKWQPTTETKEIEVGPAVKKYIGDTLKGLSDAGNLEEDAAGIYERFVEAE